MPDLFARDGTAEIRTFHRKRRAPAGFIPPAPHKKSTPAGLDQTDRGYAERCGDRGLGDPPGTSGKATDGASVPTCCALSRAHRAQKVASRSTADRRQAHRSQAGEPELAGGCGREVDDSPAGERTSIVDAHHYGATVVPIGDVYLGAERQRAIRRRKSSRIRMFSA